MTCVAKVKHDAAKNLPVENIMESWMKVIVELEFVLCYVSTWFGQYIQIRIIRE